MSRSDALEDRESPEIVVGIPAYNEAETIAEVVSEALSIADTVLVIDDGSDDETARLAHETGAVVVGHDHNRGYGAALKTIFNEAARRSPDHLVTIDADTQHDPSDVPRLVDHQRRTGAEVVIGSRFVGSGPVNAPMYRRFGLRVLNGLTKVALEGACSDPPIRDTQSGFRAFDRRAVGTFAACENMSDHMGASTDILHRACRNGFTVEEVDTEIRYDVGATSTENPISHGTVLVKNILRTIIFDP